MVSRPRVGLSFDVEEWFQTQAAEEGYPPEGWNDCESRLSEPMEYLLQLLDRTGSKATFFFLGWVVERMPRLAAKVVEAGHELGSHGYGHGCITLQTRAQFAEDLTRAEEAFERAGLPSASGYRAPSFTVVSETTWALEELSRRGYAYDSSVYPMFRHRYGFPAVPLSPFLFTSAEFSLLELPMAVSPLLGVRLPVAGGAYLRFMPASLFRAMLRRIVADGRTPVLYLHPWELDGGMRIGRCSRLQRLRQETGSGRSARRKLEELLESYRGSSLAAIAEDCDREALSSIGI